MMRRCSQSEPLYPIVRLFLVHSSQVYEYRNSIGLAARDYKCSQGRMPTRGIRTFLGIPCSLSATLPTEGNRGAGRGTGVAQECRDAPCGHPALATLVISRR